MRSTILECSRYALAFAAVVTTTGSAFAAPIDDFTAGRQVEIINLAYTIQGNPVTVPSFCVNNKTSGSLDVDVPLASVGIPDTLGRVLHLRGATLMGFDPNVVTFSYDDPFAPSIPFDSSGTTYHINRLRGRLTVLMSSRPSEQACGIGPFDVSFTRQSSSTDDATGTWGKVRVDEYFGAEVPMNFSSVVGAGGEAPPPPLPPPAQITSFSATWTHLCESDDDRTYTARLRFSPAPSAPIDVVLSAEPGVALPPSVHVGPGQQLVSFSYTVLGGFIGRSTITASTGTPPDHTITIGVGTLPFCADTPTGPYVWRDTLFDCLACDFSALDRFGDLLGERNGKAVALARGLALYDLAGMPGQGVSIGGGNGFGLAVGAIDDGKSLRSFLHQELDKGAVDYHELPNSALLGANAKGDSAGYALDAKGYQRAFLYAGGQSIDLGTLGGASSVAMSIDDAGQVAGYSAIVTGEEHAFLYDKGALKDLGTLGGKVSHAAYVAGAGRVVGASLTKAGVEHAFLFDTGLGGMVDLGTLAGFDESAASGVNGAGFVVGTASRAGKAGIEQRAFVYTTYGGMRDLNDLLEKDSRATLTAALSINDAGSILAYGTLDGAPSYFVVEPPSAQK